VINSPASSYRLWEHDLPGTYSQLEEEYALLAESRALLDFSHLEWVRVAGPDAMSFLQGLLSQNIHGIPVGTTAAAWLLDRNGKILVDMQIYRTEPQTYLLGVLPRMGSRLLELLDHYLIMDDIRLTLAEEQTCFSIQGPGASDVAPLDGAVCFSNDRSGHGGYDLLCLKENAPAAIQHFLDSGIKACGFSALDLTRVLAFIPWFGIDMKPGLNPMIYGGAGRISDTKGCFVGQETVARTRDRGRPPQLLVQLRRPGKLTADQGFDLTCAGKPAGEITSLASPPGSGDIWTLATLKYTYAESGDELKDPQGNTWLLQRRAD